jgi:hypothetical protein
MRTIRSVLIFAALTTSSSYFATSAGADVIYDNGVATRNSLSASDTTSFVRAEDFILAPGASTIDGARWTGSYVSGLVHLDDDFTIQFFNSQNAGAPPPFENLEEPQDANLAIATIDVADPNRTLLPSGLFSYSVSIPPLALQPNTRYWVSIFNDASDEQAPWLWAGQSTTNNANVSALRNQSNSWGNNIGGFFLDFQVTGTIVPEPSAAAAGLLLAWRLILRRARRVASRPTA